MKPFFIIIFLLSTSIAVGQSNPSFDKRSNNESMGINFLPHELKYGGVFKQSKYSSQFYASYYLIGIMTKEKDGQRNHLSAGFSYTRMFASNYVSLFPYYGSNAWYGNHYGVKFEPLFNLQSSKFEYSNLELTFGWYLSLSLTIGIPNNFDKNALYYGFKIGYAIPYPLFLRT